MTFWGSCTPMKNVLPPICNLVRKGWLRHCYRNSCNHLIRTPNWTWKSQVVWNISTRFCRVSLFVCFQYSYFNYNNTSCMNSIATLSWTPKWMWNRVMLFMVLLSNKQTNKQQTNSTESGRYISDNFGFSCIFFIEKTFLCLSFLLSIKMAANSKQELSTLYNFINRWFKHFI